MDRKLVFNSNDVEGFSPKGYEDAFFSKMLIDHESVGSERMVVNYFVLKPGKRTDPGSHPSPFDEVYYVLRGQGDLYLGSLKEPIPLRPDDVVFVPAGTIHSVVNNSPSDFELITVMPGPLAPGANPLYDERKKTWGTSFRLIGQKQEGGESI